TCALPILVAAQAIQVTNEIGHRLPQAVFNDRKAPFGFVDSRRTLGTDFVGAPDLLHQPVQTAAQLVLLIGQQVAALAIGQGCYDLIILTDKGTAGHFSWVRSE